MGLDQIRWVRLVPYSLTLAAVAPVLCQYVELVRSVVALRAPPCAE